MVLESLIFPLRAEKKPWELFFIGFLYSSVAIFLSLWIFEGQASIVMVLLIVMACIPIMYNTLSMEEEKDLKITNERALVKEHSKAIAFFVFLFIGVTMATVLWYVVLPQETTSILFQRQTQTITDINNRISGGMAGQFALFFTIVFNNIKVLIFCLLFSFIFGSGAIFILTWNATVIGTAIGNFIRGGIASYAMIAGSTTVAHYFKATSFGLLRYFVHGLPEITAYFYAGLAGGIISMAVSRKHIRLKKMGNILVDTSDLIILSIAFLLVAAFFEVFITPLLF